MANIPLYESFFHSPISYIFLVVGMHIDIAFSLICHFLLAYVFGVYEFICLIKFLVRCSFVCVFDFILFLAGTQANSQELNKNIKCRCITNKRNLQIYISSVWPQNLIIKVMRLAFWCAHTWNEQSN